jgi:hypothetical protein
MKRKMGKRKMAGKTVAREAGPAQGRKRPGPVANPNLAVTSVSLDADLIEWGKSQPGGLSALLRRLLAEAREKARAEEGA